MNDNPNLIKNGGKGTFFGNLFRVAKGLTGIVSPELVSLIEKAEGIKDVGDIASLIGREPKLSQTQKDLLFKRMEQDVVEMREITKRWESDMTSDSWFSKNIRPLSLAFLTVVFFLQSTLDSSISWFKMEDSWIELQKQLLLLVYAGYFGARAIEKITKIKQGK
jgi:hypothetical protein